MVDQVITKQELIDAQKDAASLELFISGTDTEEVLTRLGRTYPSIAKAIRELMETGGWKTYTTEAALLATVPTVNPSVAYAFDTKKMYRWNGTAWVNEGLSQLDQSKTYTDQKTALKVEGVLGKNLFDKSKVTNGKGLGDAGPEITAATRSVSDFIPVSANTAYSFTATTKVCFYDVNKVFVQLSVGALANVISHANAAFIRVDAATALLDTVQVEQGVNKTAYEPFGLVKLKPKSVTESNLSEKSVTSAKIAPLAVLPEHVLETVWMNMHNPTLLRIGFTISDVNGINETVNNSYDITEYIPCLPNTQYASSGQNGVFLYRQDGSFISKLSYTGTFTTPPDCYQMRFQIATQVSRRFQLNEGATVAATQQQHKQYKLRNFIQDLPSNIAMRPVLGRKYNLSDAWVAWRNGEKFPVCFLGDSTTNGNGTSGFVSRTAGVDTQYDFTVDYVAPNAYPKVTQDLIREATGNNTARIYNAGFGGQRATWAAANMDQIMGYAYADTKMVGISHGINDRTANPKLFADNFYRDIELIIKWCLEHGMQPFLITTQPVTIPDQSLPAPSASGSSIDEVANSIKKNLAEKWGLEIIDVNKFGQQFMQYSTKPLLNNIMEAGSNVIHFGDGGHKFTAELMFAHFCKRCIWTTEGERLDYSTQLMKSEINYDQLKQINPFKQGFKLELNTTQAEATNRLLQDFYIFNAGRKQLNLTAYYANAVVGQYVEVDGVQTTITQQGQNLGTLDLGLHKIKAYSSATTQLDWLGFRLVS